VNDEATVNLNEIIMRKVVRGRGIVHSNERYQKSLNTVADVLEDLMAYCADSGTDFEKELAAARRYFSQDVKGTFLEVK
jgi:hypothetical protein